MLKALGIRQVRLLSNNPDKVAALEQAGVQVVERVPCEVDSQPARRRLSEDQERKARAPVHVALAIAAVSRLAAEFRRALILIPISMAGISLPTRPSSRLSVIALALALIGSAAMLNYYLNWFLPRAREVKAANGLVGYSFGNDLYTVWYAAQAESQGHRDLYGPQ